MVAFSPDGRLVAVGGFGTTRVFATETGQELSRLTQQGATLAVTFSPNGERVAAASAPLVSTGNLEDGTAQIFETSSRSEVSPVKQPSAVSVAMSADGRWVATGHSGGILRVFNASNGEEVWHQGLQGQVGATAFSPDGRLVAAASAAVAFTPDGRPVAAASTFAVSVFEVTSGGKIWGLPEGGPVRGMAFSRDGQRFAIGSQDGTVRVFDVGSWKDVSHMPQLGAVVHIAFSPDGGRRVALNSVPPPDSSKSSKVGPVRVFETGSGEEIWRVEQPPRVWVSAIAFSPDGRWVAIGSSDKTARVFDASNGTEMAKVSLQDPVTFVSFNPKAGSRPDATQLAGLTLLAGTSRAVHLIDLSTGQESSRIETGGDVRAVHFTESQRYLELAIISSELQITRHALRPEDLRDDACSRLTRNLAVEEWKHYLGPAIPYRRTCPNLPFPPDYSVTK
jgi:WD40 repeat protein